MKWVVRTSAVRVATRRGERVYRSLDDLPKGLQQRARNSLEGPNARTILIANQEAYDRISRDVGELPPEMQRLRSSLLSRRSKRGVSVRGADREWKVILFSGLTAIVALWAFWLWSIQSGM